MNIICKINWIFPSFIHQKNSFKCLGSVRPEIPVIVFIIVIIILLVYLLVIYKVELELQF